MADLSKTTPSPDKKKNRLSDVKLPILRAENYSEWKIKITSLLKARELYDLIKSPPTKEELKEEGYELVNEEAKTVIYSTLDTKTTQQTGICDNAHDLWKKVTGNFEGVKGDLTGIAMSKFVNMTKLKHESISEYLGRYEIALNNLVASGVKVDPEMAIYVMSKTLPQNIKEGIRVWRTVNEKGETNQLISYIRANFVEENDHQEEEPTAFYSSNKNKRNWSNKNNRFKGNNTNNKYGGEGKNASSNGLECTYCKKKGHEWRSCYKLTNDNQRKQDKPRKEQAHMALQRDFNVYQQYLAGNYDDRWIIDSGATAHMTHNRAILINYTTFDTPQEILVGNGEHIEAKGRGWIFFRGKNGPKALTDVLYVPKMPVNLFSVKAAMQDGYSVQFMKNSVEVKHKGECLPAYSDGYLFTIDISILNSKKNASKNEAFAAYTLESWHKRLNHCNSNTIKRMIKEKMVDGITIGSNPEQCEDCMQGKSCRKPHPSRTKIAATDKMAILHFDTVDTSVLSLGGRRYFVLGTEEYSGYKLIDFVSKKSEVTNCVKLMVNSVILNSKRPVGCIYSDNGTEFVNSDLKEWLAVRGIIHELSSAYNAEQNGRAEASNKTVINGARTALISSGLPKTLWAEACAAGVYILNRLPSIQKPTTTCYELYYGKRPNLGNLHEFGEVAIRLIPKQLRKNKLDPVATFYRFVGYTNRFNTFRLYDEDRKRIIIDCNVRFTGKQPSPAQIEILPEPEEYASIRWENEAACAEPTAKGDRSTIINDSYGLEWSMDSTQTQVAGGNSSSLVPIAPSSGGAGPSQTHTISVNDLIHNEIRARSGNRRSSIPTRITRSKTGTLKPLYDPKSLVPGYRAPRSKRLKDVSLYSLNDEPQTVEQAKASRDWDKWRQAMTEEIQALEENNTWMIVDKPPNVKPIKAKWIFKLKLKPDGSVERYKARLVAKGYSQIPEIDYKLTFAPVASMTTVRMLLAVAIQYDLCIVQFDIKTAFLYGDLEEELYMECPQYYDAPQGKVCKLVKSLYGLKQAPRQWHKKFDSFLKRFKLIQSSYDRCLYYSMDRRIMLTIYVDDGLIVAENRQLALELIKFLEEFLTVKTMDCKSYLGLEIIRQNNTIFVTQRQYVEKTLEKFGMKDCKSTSTPEEVTPIQFENSPKLKDNFPFKELVGCLLYIVTCTRPDLAHAVSVASRTAEPTEAHWACLKRILRYLRGTTELGIVYRKYSSPKLVGYSDADYANDRETRRSTTGFVILWGGNVITWKCQRQSIVTLSTTEAEYVAGTELVKKVIPLKAMMLELRLIKDKPVQVYIDNRSTVNIVNNEEGQDRTKHIDVRHKWLNEHHDAGNITVSHIPGDEQKADILTKPLLPSKFISNRSWLLQTLTMLTLMVSILTTVSSINLRQASPVFYKSSDIAYVNELQRLRYKIIVINPCESYFTNITNKPSINEKLIKDCETAYNRIARLDQCQKMTKRNLRSILEEAYSSTGNDESILDVSSETTRRQTGHAVERQKRFVPALALFGVVIVMGSQALIAYQMEQNTENIKELAQASNTEREFLKQGYEMMREIRATIHDINHRVSHIEERLDKIDETLDEFPKIVALVNKYDNDFRETNEIFSSIDNAALNHQASPAIFKLTNNATLANMKPSLMQLELCETDIQRNDKNWAFNYQFLMPRINHKIRIMKAESFRFWNLTQPNKYCWMKYSGPRYVLVNTTNSCNMDLQEYWLNSQTVSGHPCNKENKQLGPITKLYNPDVCRATIQGSENNIQIKNFNGLYKIYCLQNNITINGQTMECPEFVFELPISNRIVLNGETYDVGEVSTVTVNAIELHINNELTEQLKVSKIKIYGSNTTGLDTVFGQLSRLTSSITEKITQRNSPITERLNEALRTPWSWLKEAFDKFSTVIYLCIGIIVAITLLPLLEASFLVWKVGQKLLTLVLNSTKRLMKTASRTSERESRPMNRIKRYLRQE